MTQGDDNVFPETNPFRVGNSWSAVSDTAYIVTLMNEIQSIVQGKSNQVLSGMVSTGGPVMAYTVAILNNNYFGGLVFGYSAHFYKFRYDNGNCFLAKI